MRRLFVSALFLLCSIAQADQTLSLPPFHAIKTEGIFDMEITVGSEQSVIFKGKDEKFNKLVVRVVDGELLINGSQVAGGMGFSLDGKFVISLPTLSLFHGKGVGEVDIEQINGDKMDILFEGAGKLTASGKIKQLQIKGVGVGEINAQKLLAEDVDADLEGVGDAKIYVSNRLNATAHGVGSLVYYGNPRYLNNSATGIGRIGAGS